MLFNFFFFLFSSLFFLFSSFFFSFFLSKLRVGGALLLLSLFAWSI